MVRTELGFLEFGAILPSRPPAGSLHSLASPERSDDNRFFTCDRLVIFGHWCCMQAALFFVSLGIHAQA
jgi:hypothetical protein